VLKCGLFMSRSRLDVRDREREQSESLQVCTADTPLFIKRSLCCCPLGDPEQFSSFAQFSGINQYIVKLL